MHALHPECSYGVPTLYYDELCPQSRSCYMLVKMLDIELDLQPINVMDGDELKKIKTSGSIPTLIDGQLVLSGAHTILMHLCDKCAGVNLSHLCPREDMQRLNVLNMLFYEGCVLYPCYNNLMTQILMKKYPNVDMSHHKAQVSDAYDFLDAKVNGQLCMAGNEVTIADISIITTLSCLNIMLPISQNQWSHLHRWFEDLKAMEYNKYNAECIQKLCHILQTQGEFPLSSPPEIQATSYPLESNVPKSIGIETPSKSSATKLEVTAAMPWNYKISLRQKFFKLFTTSSREQLPPAGNMLQDATTVPRASHSMREYPSSMLRDIISESSEGHTRKKYTSYSPRIKMYRSELVPDPKEIPKKKKYPVLLPRVRTSMFQSNPLPTDEKFKDKAPRTVDDDSDTDRQKDGQPKASSMCSRLTCVDCIQEKVQSAEC